MSQTRRVTTAWMLICLAVCSYAAIAQDIVPTVTASGQATIKAQPEILRVTLQLEGAGKDVKEALAKLAQEKESAKAKLLGLGVASEQIELGEPALGASGTSAQIRAMQMAMGMRQGKKPATGGASQVTVWSSLQAQLPLKSVSAEEKLIEGAELTEKIKTAFARALSGEEQELMEEMQQMGRGEANIPRPGEPQLTFVHVITETERNKATADAMAEAKQSASRLAAAAGGKLGAVRQISGEGSGMAGGGDVSYGGYSDYGQFVNRLTSTQLNAPGSAEAVSPQPGQVSYVVRVTVAFALN